MQVHVCTFTTNSHLANSLEDGTTINILTLIRNFETEDSLVSKPAS